MTTHVDALVIGLGVAGQDVAHRLRSGGLSVVAVERRLIGGECPNWACVPTKMMVRAGNALAEAHRVNRLAGRATTDPDWSPVARRISEATHGWDDATLDKELTAAGIRVVRGAARVTGPGAVRVDREDFTVERAIVLATGTEPAVPEIDGLAGVPYWTNRDVAELTAPPESVVILGGGPVGVEFAQILRRFGAVVTLVEMAERLVAAEDEESSAFLRSVLESDGVEVRTGVRATRVRHDGDFRVTLDDGATMTGAHLLVATGRRPNLPGLGFDEIEVDDRLRVSDGIWAIGDITGKGPFTHVATYQAKIAAADILGRPHRPADYRAVPRCVFVDPEFGAVGLTREQARERGIRIRTGRAEIPESARGFIHHVGNEGFVRLIADADRDILVGATSAGPAGGEVLGLLTLAVSAQVPLDELRDMIYAYPT
ncbi:MAG TPA: NAD(P)/FAD-dependent oxidoreductase, partial [Micromonosporaceae bacterium]